jgi:hypothetical protein
MSAEILRYFDPSHLKDDQARRISSKVQELAVFMDEELVSCAETTAGLRKLLEAKDCFVRASLSS